MSGEAGREIRIEGATVLFRPFSDVEAMFDVRSSDLGSDRSVICANLTRPQAVELQSALTEWLDTPSVVSR